MHEASPLPHVKERNRVQNLWHCIDYCYNDSEAEIKKKLWKLLPITSSDVGKYVHTVIYIYKENGKSRGAVTRQYSC